MKFRVVSKEYDDISHAIDELDELFRDNGIVVIEKVKS
jgi:hypothetical protein